MNETVDQTEEKTTEIFLPRENKPNQMTIVGDGNASSLVQAIERVAMNPNADIEKMKVLKEMVYEFEDREAEKMYSADMALCQGEIEPVARNAVNTQTGNSTYAKLDAICKAIAPIYSRHGFSVNSKTGESKKENYFLIITTIRHKGGHNEVITLDWPIDNAGMAGKINKTIIHGSSSTIIYARRVSICMGFNVATTEDSDGNPILDQKEITSNTITTDQVKELEALIAKYDTTAESICSQAGISELSKLRKEHFGPAKNEIKSFSKKGVHNAGSTKTYNSASEESAQ